MGNEKGGLGGTDLEKEWEEECAFITYIPPAKEDIYIRSPQLSITSPVCGSNFITVDSEMGSLVAEKILCSSNELQPENTC